MISQLSLKNFRKHKDLSLNFHSGITVIRAANEQGKSTLAEAISYALFGARATRNNDLSTWGEPANSHSVQLTFDSNHKTYDVSRSTRGAELTSKDLRVTGQTDVARFVESLWDLPSQSGGKLMLVSQNEMRGILSEGGAKTTQLIEQLANLDQLDNIITKLQANYHTGKTDLMEHTLANHQNTLQTLQDEQRTLGDPQQTFNDTQQTLQAKLQELHQQEQEISGSLNPLTDEYEQARELEREENQLSNQLIHAQTTLQNMQHQLNVKQITFDPNQLVQAQKQLDNLLHQQSVWQDYQAAKDYKVSSHFSGSLTELQIEIQRLNVRDRELTSRVAELKAQLNSLKAQLSDETSCPTCQREWDDLAARQAHQEHLKSEIGRIELLMQHDTLAKQGNLELKESLEELAQTVVPTLPEKTNWVCLNPTNFPPQYEWKGEIPVSVTQAEVEDARLQLVKMQKLEAQWQTQDDIRLKVQEKAEAAQQQIEVLTQQIQRLQAQHRSSQEIGDTIFELKSQRANLGYQKLQYEIQLNQAKVDLQTSQQRLAALDLRVAQTEEEIARYTSELETSKKASALLKILRQLRPSITQQVWQKLCSSITQYFSLMRGSQSIVEYGSDGFTVDGRDTASLSGSTLDILGLAIRVALVKTFMPQCDFLLLDEPFAAADTERTTNALGFLSTLGFKQVIIITHEDSTEAVAEHIITL